MIEIRLAAPQDLPALPAIEEAAGVLFDQIPFTADIPPDLTPIEEFLAAQKQGLLWIAAPAAGLPVDFALVELLDGAAHLEELDVLPDHGRHGIGTRLVQAVCDWATSQGIAAVTLSTFREVPWNAPFYQRLGFRILAESELTEELAERIEREESAGLRSELRVVMRRDLSPRPPSLARARPRRPRSR